MTQTQALTNRMLYAAEKGDTAEVDSLLAQGADINALNEDGYTALHLAARRDNLELLETLLSWQPDLEITDRKRRTALLLAVDENAWEAAGRLLSAGALATATSSGGHTVLHLAAARGQLPLVERLIEIGVPLDIQDAWNDTPLTLAANGCYYDIVLMLADMGADLNVKGNSGRTALLQLVMEQPDDTGHGLAAGKRATFLRELMERGADVNLADNYGWTPLMRAATDGDREVVRLLLKRGADLHVADTQGQNALMWALRGGQRETVQELLALGADIEARDRQGQTLLMRAMREPDLEMVRDLLDKGADIHAVDRQGKTAFRLAAEKGHTEVAQLLAERGADVNAKDEDGETALDYAVRNRLDEMAHLLMQLGTRAKGDLAAQLGFEGNINALDDRGWTPLMRVVRSGDTARAQLLLDAGADLETADERGRTALMEAATGAYDSVLEMLLERGADLNARDGEGNTVLMLAVEAERPERVRTLLAKGVDIDAANHAGVTALLLAAGAIDPELLPILIEAGADVHAQDAQGSNALLYAARMRNEAQIGLLLDNGVDPEQPNQAGRSPLLFALEGHQEELRDLLVRNLPDPKAAEERAWKIYYAALARADADPNEPDEPSREDWYEAEFVSEGRVSAEELRLEAEYQREQSQRLLGSNALFSAAAHGEAEFVEQLLGQGIEIDARNEAGETALMLAVRAGHEVVVRLLLRAGASSLARDAQDRTVLTIAADARQVEILRLLLAEPALPTPPGDDLPLAAPAPPATSTSPRSDLPLPAPPLEGVEGRILPPEQEVDCDCDVRLERPVFRDHSGVNTRVTACMRCGKVSVTESLVEEPRPHDVRCVGNQLIPVEPALLEWFAAWPRRAFGVWTEDRNVFLPASLRCQTVEGLALAEAAALKAQAGLSYRERIEQAGYPAVPCPVPLSLHLQCFAETWTGLHLTDTTPFDDLVCHANQTTWASPFAQEILARRPNFEAELAALLRSRDRGRYRAALSIIGSRKIAPPEVLQALLQRLRETPRTEEAMYPLLDTLYYLGPAAAGAIPILKEIASEIGDTDYYLHKRVQEIAKLLKA